MANLTPKVGVSAMFKLFDKIPSGQKLSGILNPRQPQTKYRRMVVKNEIQNHFRCIEPCYKEIPRTNVIIISIFRGVGLHGGERYCKAFPTFSCLMILCSIQTCRHRERLRERHKHGSWRHVFPLFPSHVAQPRHLRQS